MDFKELGMIAAYGFGFSFSIIFILTFFLSNFIALKKPPKARTFLTVGVSYVAYLALVVSSLPSEYFAVAIGLSIPSALVVFYYFRRSFAKLWYDDPSLMPAGTKLANDDWRVALYFLLAVIVAVLVRKLFYGFSI